MNIFVTDSDPVLSARNLDNQRLVKMVTETAQMTSSVLKAINLHDDSVYKPAYPNHPCTRWASGSRGNFDWLTDHGLALGDEYTYRYGKEHSSARVIEICRDKASGYTFDSSELLPFCNCTTFKDIPVIEAYRRYMIEVKWITGANFGRRGRPSWYR